MIALRRRTFLRPRRIINYANTQTRTDCERKKHTNTHTQREILPSAAVSIGNARESPIDHVPQGGRAGRPPWTSAVEAAPVRAFAVRAVRCEGGARVSAVVGFAQKKETQWTKRERACACVRARLWSPSDPKRTRATRARVRDATILVVPRGYANRNDDRGVPERETRFVSRSIERHRRPPQRR